MVVLPRSKVSELFGDFSDWLKMLHGGRAKWVAVQWLDGVPKGADCVMNNSEMITSGWNWSYHECCYNPAAATVGSSPSRARKRLRVLMEKVGAMRLGDSVALANASRAAVRFGD